MRICKWMPVLLFIITAVAVPSFVGANQKPSAKEIANKLKHLEKKNTDAQVQSMDIVGTLSRKMTKKLSDSKNKIKDDPRWQANLDIRKSNITDIEKARKRLKRDVAEWTEHIDYTEVDEIKKGIADALAVAEADHLDIEKLIRLYDMSKKVIRTTQFRSAGLTTEERIQNADLNRDEITQRILVLEDRYKKLKQQYENTSSFKIWTRKSLEMDMAGVQFEILQHKLGLGQEDMAQPMYVMMDGLFTLGISLSSWTKEGRKAIKDANLEGHEFDSAAARDMLKNYSLKLLSMTLEGEAMVAQAALDRQNHRTRLYKRTSIAFIRALISRKDPRKPCPPELMVPKTTVFKGREITTFGCPDPVVENLRAYLDAIRKFQDAEADRTFAEAEVLVAEQQIIADFLSALPLVGESLDIYSVYAGENLAGVKLSGLERSAMGVLVVLPMVGPHALEQVMELDYAKKKMKDLAPYFLHVAELADDLAGAGTTIKKEISEAVKKHAADQLGVSVRQLKEMLGLVQEAPWVLDDAARAKMKLFQTMRNAADDRIAANVLRGNPYLKGMYKKALQQSQDLMDDGLRRLQGTGFYTSYMPTKHRQAFADVAKSKRKAIVMRPVGKDAAEQLAKDFAATKGLNIKPKSANWGPQKAFIPVDQNFSKLGKPDGDFIIDIEKIKKFNAKAQACLNQIPPCANKTKLRVSLDGEVGSVDVVIVSKKGKGKTPVYRNKKGELFEMGEDNIKRPLAQSDLDSTTIEHMEVFADANGAPLTADYDLLAVGSKREAQLANASTGAGFDIDTASQRPHAAGNKGTISKEIDEVVDDLNKAGKEAGYNQGNLVHHGPDTFNPATEGVFTASEKSDGLALTVFDPDYGELAIPPCDRKYMEEWCKATGACDYKKICPEGVTSGCIPVDPDRILKDYFHNARLRGIDISPHSSWNWGNYNAAGGWTQTSFLKMPEGAIESLSEFYQKQLRELWKTNIGASVYRRMAEPAKKAAGEEN